VATELAAAAIKIATGLELVGLNSVDFLVARDDWHLIEVNPRPGATLDIFDSHEAPLFARHVAACRGEVPDARPHSSGAAAARIVYTRRDMERVPEFDWPDWTADRQPPGTALNPGAPVCTALAEADTPEEARRLAMERGDSILAKLGAI
jgi:predicted ATP-grasp superfamily ATP-dependent carboligase